MEIPVLNDKTISESTMNKLADPLSCDTYFGQGPLCRELVDIIRREVKKGACLYLVVEDPYRWKRAPTPFPYEDQLPGHYALVHYGCRSKKELWVDMEKIYDPGEGTPVIHDF